MTLSKLPRPGLDIPDEPSPAQYKRIAREIEAAADDGQPKVRLAMLSSFTLDFLEPTLVVEAARTGLHLRIHFGAFGQLEQPVLDRESSLFASEPDALVLNFQPGDIDPDAVHRYYATGGSALSEVCDDLTNRLIASGRAFREKTGKPTLIANFATPARVPLGPFDATDPAGLTHRLAEFNRTLAQRLHEEADLYVWDYAGLVRQTGAAEWTDRRLEMLARVSIASDRLPVVARHLVRTLAATRRRPAKCLVLDLDNTLWGGVVGDDGMQGLVLGDDWPGTPFKAFQRVVLGLRDRGILLAISSKNDEGVAEEAFRQHPDMLISWDDLAATRINWRPKSENMREIAEELNIGVDALVLFDDNPVERAEVRAAVPEAGVIEVPTDPIGYVDALMDSGCFDSLGLSPEDFERAEMYRVERERTSLREETQSVDDFLTSLEMVAEVGSAGPETLGRIAQLVGKTNQFNLTTRRHAPAEIGRMAESTDWVVGWLRLRDRFGDQGLIAVAIAERRDDVAHLDTFLMSCRVMNRGVEKAMMSYLVDSVRRLGCSTLVGEYRPTPKNHMVSDLLDELGFQAAGQHEEGTTWKLDLESSTVSWPDHIERVDSTVDPEAPPAGRVTEGMA